MHNATPLTIRNTPMMANLFVPGCSSSGEGYPCDWSAFNEVAKIAIVPQFVERWIGR